MVQLIQHEIKASLKHGAYYNVYVTQVNKQGLESPKSAPAIIRIGDVNPPVIPTLSMDTSYGTNGFLANRGKVNLKVKWTPNITNDDLKEFVLYTWSTWDNWDGDGVKSSSFASSASTQRVTQNTATDYTLMNQTDKQYLYIGIQAIDYSNNRSDIYVIKVLCEDTAVLETPVDAPLVEPCGDWKLKVTVNFPISHEIERVAIYRDDVVNELWNSNVPVGYILFSSSLQGSFIDELEPMDGLSHKYAYAWVNYNGTVSNKSPYSALVTAKAIDTSMIDKETFKALNQAWTSEFISEGGVMDIEKLKTDLIAQTKTIADLWSQLSVVQQNYDGLFNNYNLLVNNYNLLSAKVSTQDGTISNMQSSISLNAQQIAQKVTQIDLDSKAQQITNAYTSLHLQNKDYIGTVVSMLNNNAVAFSSIGQMANAIQLKVGRDEVISRINMSPETIDISGDKLHISANTLFDGDVRINGILNANAVYNAGYKVRSSVMLKGQVWTEGTIPLPAGYTQEQCVWGLSGGINPNTSDPSNTTFSLSVDPNRIVHAKYDDGNTSGNCAAYYWIMGVK